MNLTHQPNEALTQTCLFFLSNKADDDTVTTERSPEPEHERNAFKLSDSAQTVFIKLGLHL